MHFFLQRTMIFWNLLSCFYIFVVVWKMKCQCCCYERFSFQFCFIFGILHFVLFFEYLFWYFSGAESFFSRAESFSHNKTKLKETQISSNDKKEKRKKCNFYCIWCCMKKHLLLFWHRNIRSSVDHLSQKKQDKRNKTKETRHKTKETRQKKQDTRQKKQDTRQKKQDTRQKKQDKIKHTQPNLKKKKQKISKNRHNNENKKQKQKAYSTSTSRVVPHRSTMLAASNLTARFRWDVVYFRSYGRKQKR